MDGPSYVSAGRTCHLLLVACLLLPLVSFMAVITKLVQGQTVPPEIHISHSTYTHNKNLRYSLYSASRTGVSEVTRTEEGKQSFFTPCVRLSQACLHLSAT